LNLKLDVRRICGIGIEKHAKLFTKTAESLIAEVSNHVFLLEYTILCLKSSGSWYQKIVQQVQFCRGKSNYKSIN